jgi:hypothetical protein
MRTTTILFLAFTLVLTSCSKDENEPAITIQHTGEKWNITSVEYNIVDQSLTSPTIKTGTKANAGAFYFNSAKGSFDINIDNYHKEDVFGFTQSSSGISVTSINQSVSGSMVSQNVIAMSGEYNTATTMTLQGSITKQSTSGQFIMTATFQLTKQP